MRSVEFGHMAVAVLGGPLLAWLAGSLAGSRDWKILRLLLLLVVLTIAFQWLVLVDPPVPALSAASQAVTMLASLEFVGFVLAFMVFVGMLGWAATPVRTGDVARPEN